MSEHKVSLSTIRQILINVKDLARATAFYRDTLGMKLLFEFPGMAFFDAGGVRLYLGRADNADVDHPASILYYLVTDIVATHESLVAKGVDVVAEPRFIAPMPDHDLWLADYRDSEGNIFALMSEVSRA